MMVQSQATDSRLNGASSAKGMTMHGFGRTDGNSVSLFSKDLFDSERFRFIIERRRTAMGVNISNLLRRYLCFLQSELHRSCGWLALWMRSSHMVGIIGEAIAKDFTENRRPALYSVL